MADSKIFISYRREDTAGHAGRLNDALSQHFGANRVFMDVDSIEYGVDFVEVVQKAVGSCQILIALIGTRWLDAKDKEGRRRLDNPQDLVRVEIETALKRGVKVIPAIVQDAVMPTEDVLPEPLTKLARRNAIEISDNRWKYDVKRLIETLEKELGIKKPEEGVEEPVGGGEPQPKPKPLLKIALIALTTLLLTGVAGLIIIGYFTTSGGSKTTPVNTDDGQAKSVNSNNVNAAPQDPTGATKYYEGFINKEQISLRLKRDGQFLSGTITNYSTRRLNIQVKGTIDKANNVVLQELDPDTGKETGIYRGQLDGLVIEGIWTAPDGSGRSLFHLKEVR